MSGVKKTTMIEHNPKYYPGDIVEWKMRGTNGTRYIGVIKHIRTDVKQVNYDEETIYKYHIISVRESFLIEESDIIARYVKQDMSK